jgi:hypothetical protein
MIGCDDTHTGSERLAAVRLALPERRVVRGIPQLARGAQPGRRASSRDVIPLIFAVYLLASRRVRAGLVSMAVFAFTIVAGYAVLPAASGEYWAGRFLDPEANVAVRQNQSLYAFVAHLLSDGPDAHRVWLMSARRWSVSRAGAALNCLAW